VVPGLRHRHAAMGLCSGLEKGGRRGTGLPQPRMRRRRLAVLAGWGKNIPKQQGNSCQAPGAAKKRRSCALKVTKGTSIVCPNDGALEDSPRKSKDLWVSKGQRPLAAGGIPHHATVRGPKGT